MKLNATMNVLNFIATYMGGLFVNFTIQWQSSFRCKKEINQYARQAMDLCKSNGQE